MQPVTPIVALLTDFGLRDAYVGVMKGVILGICPQARLVDLSHEVPPQGIVPGALILCSAVGAFPNGTIYLAVVDPGVGSARRPLVVATPTALFVGPDNGVLAPAVASAGGVTSVRCLDRPQFFRQVVSHTFHGRDIFAPAVGHLATGIAPETLGSPTFQLTPLSLPEPRGENGELHGEIIYVDHYGNLITNIPAAALADFPTQSLSVTIPGVCSARVVSAYAEVAVGSPLAIVNSWAMLEIAVRNGNAARQFAAGSGSPVVLLSGDRQ